MPLIPASHLYLTYHMCRLVSAPGIVTRSTSLGRGGRCALFCWNVASPYLGHEDLGISRIHLLVETSNIEGFVSTWP